LSHMDPAAYASTVIPRYLRITGEAR